MLNQTFDRTLTLPCTAQEAFAWHARMAAFDRLIPPWLDIEIVSRPPALVDDSRLAFRICQGPIKGLQIKILWVARHEGIVSGERFIDVQEKGPFAFWRHRHLFEPADASCLLRDSISYRLPMGRLGTLVAGWRVRADLEAMFSYRHFTTWHDLRLHRGWQRSLRVGLVSAPQNPLGRTVFAMLSTGGQDVEQVAPGESFPDHWQGLDAVVDVEGEGGHEGREHEWRLSSRGPSVVVRVGPGSAEALGTSRRVRLKPAPLLGARGRFISSDAGTGPAGPDHWLALDDAAAAVLFALQKDAIEGPVDIRAGHAPALQREGFEFRHLDFQTTRAHYAGRIRSDQIGSNETSSGQQRVGVERSRARSADLPTALGFGTSPATSARAEDG